MRRATVAVAIILVATACAPAKTASKYEADRYMANNWSSAPWFQHIMGYRAEGQTIIVETDLSTTAAGRNSAMGICQALTHYSYKPDALRVNGRGDVVLVVRHPGAGVCEVQT